VALALGLAASGCGGGARRPPSVYRDTHPLPIDTMTVAVREIGSYGGQFVIGQTAGPKTFNAIMANETSSTDCTQRMFAGLTDFDNETQQNYPLLAKSWEMSPDGLVWTWHLRRGAAFSDGHPITADDVLFSFEVAYDDSLHSVMQDVLKVKNQRFEVSKVDSYTVITKIAGPYALMVPAIGALRIMPKHVLETAFRSGRFAAAYTVSANPDSIVTSGAWRLERYAPGEKTVLARNPYWFGVDPQGHRLPYLDRVVFLIVPDQNTAALKFQAGDLDGLDSVKPEDYKTYAENQRKGDYTLYEIGASLNTNCFWFNLNRVREPRPGKRVGETCEDPVKYSWFATADFRRAVSMAIDRDAIIRSVLFGDGVKAWSLSTPANKAWYSERIVHYDYDPQQARRLLDGLGWRDTDGDGFREDGQGHTLSFALKTHADNAARVGMCNFIKDDLAKVGIRCFPTSVDFNTLVSNLRNDFQYDAVLVGFQSAVPPDPGMAQNVLRSSGLTHYWNIKQPRPETSTEAEIDRLVEANVTTADLAARRQTWEQIETLVNRECFIEWLPSVITKLPVRNRFGNLQPSVMPHRLLWNIDRVFVKHRT
jgi:peptide/nickel transport system substrate-binding protein